MRGTTEEGVACPRPRQVDDHRGSHQARDRGGRLGSVSAGAAQYAVADPARTGYDPSGLPSGMPHFPGGGQSGDGPRGGAFEGPGYASNGDAHVAAPRRGRSEREWCHLAQETAGQAVRTVDEYDRVVHAACPFVTPAAGCRAFPPAAANHVADANDGHHGSERENVDQPAHQGDLRRV
jgi:hypothetical protein